jgi:peptide/nickel transport system permease protein
MNQNAPAFEARARLPLRVFLFLGRLLAFFLLLHALVFALFDLLPGAEFLQSGWAGVDPALLASTRERLGLSGSWLERYWSSLNHLLHGNLGRSVAGDYPVSELFANRFWHSVPQWLGAAILCALAIPLGMVFCTRRIGIPRRVWLFTSHALLIPQFMAAMVLFAFYISAVSPWIPQNLDTVARGCFAIISAALLPAGMLFIAAANSARSYASENFATTYLAMGMSWTLIRWRLLRNVLLAMRPLIGRVILAVLTGTLFAELTFSINGVGKLFVDSLRSSDWPTMQAWVLFVGAITLTVSLVERRQA